MKQKILAMASIQSVEPSTYEALAGYLSSSDSTTGPPDVVHKWFRLWWDDNPAFRAEMKRGWILADLDQSNRALRDVGGDPYGAEIGYGHQRRIGVVSVFPRGDVQFEQPDDIQCIDNHGYPGSHPRR